MVCKNQKKDIPPDRLSSLLAAQGILCALALMALLLLRMLSPALYRQSRRIYLEQFEEEQLLPQLVRFADAAADALSLPVWAEDKAPQNAQIRTILPEMKMHKPVAQYTVSSVYGWRKHPVTRRRAFHYGVDLACAEGTPVAAAMEGAVEYTGRSAAAGNYLRLRHSDGYETVYCHLQYIFVRTGETVRGGQLLGTAGRTGDATGPHLHFSLLRDDVYYDPSALLDAAQ